MNEYMDVAQSPALWIFAAAIFLLIIFQAVRFYSLARANAREGHATAEEMGTAMRVGAISAIGPSVAVAIVALSLIPIFGTPAVLMRIGMIGSVPYEVAAANASAESLGVTLGGEGFDSKAFALTFFTMALGASIWMAQVVLATSSMGKLSEKIATWKPWAMAALTGGALMGAFAYLAVSQAKGGTGNIIVLLASAFAMVVVLVSAERFKLPRLREWALGIAMVFALIVAGFIAN